MEKDPTRTSTSEVLKRLQNETQRVKNRLSPEKSTKREETHTQGATGNPLKQARDDNFGDPNPSEIMSDHLKNEHEAFRAKYVSLFYASSMLIRLPESKMLFDPFSG